MTIGRYLRTASLAAVAAACTARGYEVNAWPFLVQEKDEAGKTVSWTGAGPFLFSGPTAAPEAGTAEGLRPFYERVTGAGAVHYDVLYPIFYDRRYGDHYKWSVYSLINGYGIDASETRAGGPKDRHFDVWPFYFSHETDTPIDTYTGLFPIAGSIKFRLGFSKIDWFLFPLYAQSRKSGITSTYTPWPFVRTVTGAAKGFGLWPVFGTTRGPGAERHTFAFWPLIWDNTLDPSLAATSNATPSHEVGFLPFYTRETGPGLLNENWLWPFFGRTERSIPNHFSERRYFWPFLVQGRGDDKLVQRWGPFYTHSLDKGLDSKWVLWPFWHRRQWVDADLRQTKTQFFYFLYWSLDQESVSRPWLAHAYKRHIWPLASIWDNGAGSREVEAPSPLEVFFPENRDMRVSWTPLFSLYTHQRRPTGETRTSILWNAVTWRRNGPAGLVELHVGPLLGMRRSGAGDSWSILGVDFGAKSGDIGIASRLK
ncbi:MAG TPA: hypothetical protein VGG34_08830 [Opitutaceae bacterium]|jgi:hypothetical protein